MSVVGGVGGGRETGAYEGEEASFPVEGEGGVGIAQGVGGGDGCGVGPGDSVAFGPEGGSAVGVRVLVC